MAAVAAKAQFLRIYEGATTHHRWQGYWEGQTVSFAGASWEFQRFEADGIVAGDVAAEASLTLSLPATSETLPVMRDCLQTGKLVELSQYAFDPRGGNDSPQEGQALVARYLGEVVGIRGTFTRLEVELGNALAPVGIQLPPRTMTSELIGVPCQL